MTELFANIPTSCGASILESQKENAAEGGAPFLAPANRPGRPASTGDGNDFVDPGCGKASRTSAEPPCPPTTIASLRPR
eukprot:scaffold14678_cov101-Isochrysis_galbana.AAC.3